MIPGILVIPPGFYLSLLISALLSFRATLSLAFEPFLLHFRSFSPFPVRSVLFLFCFLSYLHVSIGQIPRVGQLVMLGILVCLRVSLVAVSTFSNVLCIFVRDASCAIGAGFLSYYGFSCMLSGSF